MEIREKMNKVVIFIVKGCYRSSCNHPFLVGMLCFLVFLYSSVPFLFWLLVSSSPVLVCTAILLGTLLSFGKPNIPEIEREERTSHEIVSLDTGFYGSSVGFDVTESVSIERYRAKGKDVVEELVKDNSSGVNEIGGDGSDRSFERLSEERSKEMEFVDLGLESKSEMFGERLGDVRIVENHYSLIPEVDDERIDLENDRSPTGSVDSKVVNVDCLDSPPCTPWRHVNQEDPEENEDDSGSDRAESSSPDASMADILPVLDELHPLLDEDTPHPDASDESSNESDDDSEKQESEVAENDNEEETHDEEDQTKSAIKWTEEDERNLMDLGSSELERNQRLENLIARRRARKTLSVVPETNLIDLESSDFTFSVPPILTSRINPFDHAKDSYEDMGLPPIPGSAPSVLLHRRNPFDIPYDSSEEKPDLMEDSFQQEFTPFQSKEHFFRRHESFNAWRTPFVGINRSEKQDSSRFRPFFVAERLGSEGTSDSHFQRQSSGLSDSKASSVPDTGSVTSSENTEEETSAIEDEATRELDLISRTEQATELVGHGSESSEEENSIELGKEDTEYHQEAESSLVVEQKLANQFETSLTETYSNVEAHDQRYTSISSSSSLSEESERIYVENEVEDFPSFIDERYHPEDPSISVQPSLNITPPVRDYGFLRDPVYDLSPSVKETLPENDLAPAVVKKSVSFSERVTELGIPEMETDGSSDMMESSSSVHMDYEISETSGVPETEIISGGYSEMAERVDVNYYFSESDQVSVSATSPVVPETVVDQNAKSTSGRSLDLVYEDLTSPHSPSFDTDTDVKEEVDSENVEGTSPAPLNMLSSNSQSISDHTTEGEYVLAEKGVTRSNFNDSDHQDQTLTSPQDHEETQKSDISVVEPVREASTGDSRSNYNSQINNEHSLDIQVPTSPKSIAIPAEVFETQSVEELDEMKEIDEQLLEELDSVGDFHRKESIEFDDPVQHDVESSITLDDSGHLQSTEEIISSKTKQDVTEVNSLEEISDIEENDTVMAEIEAHFAKTIEAMIINAELTSVKIEVVHNDPPPPFVDLELQETGKTHGEANNLMETRDIEGTFPELQSFDGNSALKLESRSYSSEALGFSEDGTGTAVDVRADLDSPRELKSGIEESDATETLQLSLEEPAIIEAKIPESDDVRISERKSMDDSVSALKQASQSSPNEALKISEDVGVDISLPREALSDDDDSDVKKTPQNSLEEPYSIEAKTPESHEVVMSERKYLDDSFPALKPESQSSPTEALKMSEDVRGDIYSPSKAISGAEEFEVKKTKESSLEESYSVEAKTPESDDVLLSERKYPDESFFAPKQESQSSPIEALKLSEDESAKNNIESPREAKTGGEESDVKETQQSPLEEPNYAEVKSPESHDVTVSDAGKNIKETDKKSSSSSSSSSSDSSSSDSDKE